MNRSKNILQTFSSKIIILVLNLTTGIIIARILGPSGKGQYAIALLVSSVIASMISFNFGESAIYFLNRKKIKLGTVITTDFVFLLSISIVAITVVFLLWQMRVLPWTELYDKRIFMFVIILLPVLIARLHILEILRGIKKFISYNNILIFQPIVHLLFVVIIINVWHLWVSGILLSIILSNIMVIILGFFSIINTFSIKPKFSKSYLHKSIIFGLKGHIGNILQKFNTRLDQFFITPYWNSAMLGYYSVAVSICEVIWYLPDSIGIVMFPEIATVDNDNKKKLASKSLRIDIFFTVTFVLILSLSAWFIIPTFYSSAYKPAIKVVYYLLPGIFFMSISKVISKFFSGTGCPEINTYTSTISALFTIFLCIILIPRYNIIGAAIASSIAYAVRSICDLYIFLKRTQYSLIEVLFVKRSDLFIIKNTFFQLFKK